MTLQGQILFKLEKLADDSGWGVYAKLDENSPDLSDNLVFSSGQVSMLVSPGFEIKNLNNLVGFWGNISRVNTPIENSNVDYVDIGFIVNDNFPYDKFANEEEVLLFTFEPVGDCPDVIKLMDSGDPFYKPNSANTNSGNYFPLLDITTESIFHWIGNYQDCIDICIACLVNTSILNENLIEENLKIAPNPSNGNFNISLGEVVNEVAQISIVNNLGQTVFEIENVSSENEISLDLPNGIYNVLLQKLDKSLIAKRIIISK